MSTLRPVAAFAAALGLSFLAAPSLTMAADPPAAAKPAVEPEAMSALQKMSTFLSGLNTFELVSQTSLDLVTYEGQRIQLDGVTKYKVRRPDGFVIELDSDVKKRTFVYDGKQFTVYAPKLGFYSTVAAPPTIRQALDQIRRNYGITLPLEDLFRWNDPASRGGREAVTSAFDVGPATIDGVETEQYAFREGDIDWQVWIQPGDQPLPRKLAIVDRTDPANPGYTARLSWTLNPQLSADDFTFKPDNDAKAIRMSAITGQ